MLIVRCAMLLLAVLVLAGCGGKKKPEADRGDSASKTPAAQKAPDPAKIMGEVSRLMEKGSTNAAIRVLEKAYKDPEYRDMRGGFFGEMLRLMAAAGQFDEMTNRYLQAVGKDEALVQGGFDVVPMYFQYRQDMAGLQAWTEKMLSLTLPEDLHRRAFLIRMHALLQAGEMESLLAQLPESIRVFGEPGCRDALGPMVGYLVGKKLYGEAGRMLDAIEKSAGDSAALKGLVAAMRVDLPAVQARWDETENALRAAAPVLDDDELAACLDRTVSAAVRTNNTEAADRFCRLVLDEQPDKAKSRERAAMLLVGTAAGAGNGKEVVVRMDFLLTRQFSADFLASLFTRQFYAVVKSGSPADLTAMMQIGRKIEPGVTDEDIRDGLTGVLLDGTFLAEDYAGALALLERGIPGRDEAWHAMAISKVKAHLALAKGDTAEAVKNFRVFMTHVDETWKGPEVDPSTGITHTKEMTMAFNARRIGDILRKNGDDNGASSSYAEAKVFYEKALASLKPDSAEYKKVTDDLKTLARPPERPAVTPVGEK